MIEFSPGTSCNPMNSFGHCIFSACLRDTTHDCYTPWENIANQQRKQHFETFRPVGLTKQKIKRKKGNNNRNSGNRRLQKRIQYFHRNSFLGERYEFLKNASIEEPVCSAGITPAEFTHAYFESTFRAASLIFFLVFSM